VTRSETNSLYDSRVGREGKRIYRVLRRRWSKFIGRKATVQIQYEMAGDAAREVLKSIGNVLGLKVKNGDDQA
jgi:hypothetical protein